jgi:hypothetical protein
MSDWLSPNPPDIADPLYARKKSKILKLKMPRFDKSKYRIELLNEEMKHRIVNFKNELRTFNSKVEDRIDIMIKTIQGEEFQKYLLKNNYKFWIDLVNGWGEFELMLPFLDNFQTINLPKHYSRYCLFPEWQSVKQKYYLDDTQFKNQFPNLAVELNSVFEQILNRTLYCWFIKIWHKKKLFNLGYSTHIVQNSIARICDINRVCNFEELPNEIQNKSEDGYEHIYDYELTEEVIMDKLSDMYI